MGKIDPKFVKELSDWMNNDHSSDEKIREGANLLLRINRNTNLYQQILRTPQRMLKKLEYEIGKHLRIRMDGLTTDDVVKMNNEIMPEVDSAIKAVPVGAQDIMPGAQDIMPVVMVPEDGDGENVVVKGIRPDHDKLPEEIKLLWVKNAERWKKIKELFELIKSLNEPCDRYEHLKILKELWYSYKNDMSRYDDFHLTGDEGSSEGEGGHELSDIDKNFIDNAHSYISRNLPVLMELKKEAQEPDFSEEKITQLENLRMRVQSRVDTLIRFKVEMSQERIADLLSVDIRVTNPEYDAEGNKS